MIQAFTVPMDSRLEGTRDQVNLWTFHLLFGNRCQLKPEGKLIREEQKRLARKGAEKAEKQRAAKNLEKLEQSKKGVASIVNQLHAAYQQEEDPIPTMPTCKYSQERHRIKCARVSIMSGEKIINTLVARPVNKKEIRANPKAQESLDIEWNKLVKKTAWLYDTVQEWSKVSDGAKKKREESACWKGV